MKQYDKQFKEQAVKLVLDLERSRGCDCKVL